MPKVLEPPTNQRLFILEALKQDLRLDGRAFDSFRPLKLQFGRELGLADVRLGQTRCEVFPTASGQERN
jgi:exosome complex component RRP45